MILHKQPDIFRPMRSIDDDVECPLPDKLSVPWSVSDVLACMPDNYWNDDADLMCIFPADMKAFLEGLDYTIKARRIHDHVHVKLYRGTFLFWQWSRDITTVMYGD